MTALLVVLAITLLAVGWVLWVRHDGDTPREPKVKPLPRTWDAFDPPEYDAEYDSWLRGGGR